MAVYTIGFTQTTAERFFNRLKENGIDVVLDVRLKNTSQLAAFARMPDIAYFLKEIAHADYVHDELLAPTEEILSAYKKGDIDWAEYEVRFAALMKARSIDERIKDVYADAKERRWCLLCSEATAEKCHRRLAAERFADVLGVEVVHL